MKIWTPKKPPCNPAASHLQSLSDARAHRDRFRFNPLAKVGGLFVPAVMKFAGGYPGCCEQFECTFCQLGKTPAEMSVEITNMTASCGEGDGTYIAPFYEGGAPSGCFWVMGPDWPDIFGFQLIRVQTSGGPTNYNVRVIYQSPPTYTLSVQWNTTISHGGDCRFLDLNIPPSGGTLCDNSASTCIVNAL